MIILIFTQTRTTFDIFNSAFQNFVGQGRMQALIQIEVPVSWDENRIIEAFKEIYTSQMNKEDGLKIKSYSSKDLNIIIDVLKKIMINKRELHHEIMPLINGFLLHIDTKEKATVNLKIGVTGK